jgi:mevalonate kinase
VPESAEASACAKAILIGEHAVVYGHPAIAVPLSSLRANARWVEGNSRNSGLRIEAPDIGRSGFAGQEPELEPLALAVRIAFDRMAIPMPPSTLHIESAIPVAGGLGSGAAVAVATIRACSAFAGRPLDPDTVSSLAFEVEKLHHGTPSGIDNAVVALETPLLFSKAEGPRPLDTQPLVLVLADSGIRASTADMVARVSKRREGDRGETDSRFRLIGEAVENAKRALGEGSLELLGRALTEAQGHLSGLGVSCEALDRLVTAALGAGALGAKLSGAGGGGYMLALAPSKAGAKKIGDALAGAGGRGIFQTQVGV